LTKEVEALKLEIEVLKKRIEELERRPQEQHFHYHYDSTPQIIPAYPTYPIPNIIYTHTGAV
jgi:hypothetical protein